MTDPTADAIAALDHARGCVASLTTKLDDREWQPNRAFVEYARNELKAATYSLAALLSVQGQAGKPVATEAMLLAALVSYFGHTYSSGPSKDAMRDALNAALALYVQPQPAAGVTVALTTARTALEAAERNVRLLRNRLAPGLDETSANLILDDLNDALRATSPTEKDDRHGRG